MYNLNASEILMVDGGGDGNSNGKHYASGLVDIGIGAAIGLRNPLLGLAYAVANLQGNYSNNNGVGTGTNQSYGGYGRDTGGGMMQAEGSRGGYGR
ncbi:hypothetical protein [Aliivibrio fischeri]|uniref:hypothetical protein n=1 Tax=Aliivibrio fischeri TaxID=668 RepID=UPI00084C9AED|nr:hypothetical protein [Aliivibrio fischeri]OED51348.1 hypothetical protein BEI47_10370 [Aliivibrio fischeri]